MASKRLKLDLLKWYPILANDLLATTFPQKTFYVATILDKTQIQKLTQHFIQLSSFNKYSLKRIRQSTSESDEKVFEMLISDSDKLEEIPKEIGKYLDNIRQIQLPYDMPLTREQFNRISSHWPIKFHEDKEIEILVNNKFNIATDEKTLLNHDKYARLALKISKENFNKAVSVIVDPALNSIVSIGIDDRENYPLHHSTINALNNVSKKQLSLEDDSTVLNDIVADFDIKKDDSSNYLCTNYHAYLTHEPCSMCAMALVHSRIFKVFYLHNVSHGYLFSSCKLHTVKSLHHKFQVFKASNIDGVEEDCKIYFSIK